MVVSLALASKMSPIPAIPSWLNFSSMFREAVTAQEARTGMEKSHHLAASLYFGIAALEAFSNQKMRAHLTSTTSEEEIYERLFRGRISDKLKKWPEELLGKSVEVDPETWELIMDCNELRGQLTHPKTHGQDIYDRLENVDPSAVVGAVGEYIARYHEAEGTRFPYWIFGWNYFNPRRGSYDFLLMNEQQFSFSLLALGFNAQVTDEWMDAHLGTFEGYTKINEGLEKSDRCEPKAGPFPYKPILCRRWWTAEHQRTCGHIADEALLRAHSTYSRNTQA